MYPFQEITGQGIAQFSESTFDALLGGCCGVVDRWYRFSGSPAATRPSSELFELGKGSKHGYVNAIRLVDENLPAPFGDHVLRATRTLQETGLMQIGRSPSESVVEGSWSAGQAFGALLFIKTKAVRQLHAEIGNGVLNSVRESIWTAPLSGVDG